MVNRNADSSNPQQGDGGVAPTEPVSAEQQPSRPGNTVFKSGPLFISSKGIGWTSWKKRWFVLTRTSLVFFRSDPNAGPQKGGEANLTLGGIDLNSSGSVVVKADKKLLTVLFPDGREGRAFTLKAETSEDLYEWKTAVENALAQAPSGAAALENTLAQASGGSLLTGQSEILKDDAADAIEGSFEQCTDKQPVKSLVIDKSDLLSLQDGGGNPSFLEKALRFVEQYGVKVEGILRQAADVDEVECRIQDFEQGKNEFSPDEDAHVIADCVKHILRASPPIPALCCTSLLDAFKTTHGSRVNAMRAAIAETFPEPTRLLLQRLLKMMQTVASHKSENLMSTSAVAACMAPLLLRPLMSGDYEVGHDLNMGGDGSLQLLQAAAAANHAQAIVITLMEEFRNIFSEDSSTESHSEGSGSEDEELTGDEGLEDDDYDDEDDELDIVTEDDYDEDASELDSETEDGRNEENDLPLTENGGDEEKHTEEGDDSECKLTGSSNENSGNDGSDTDYSKGRKNLSMESIEYTVEDEIAIQKLESTKANLQNSIEKEAKENAVLQEGLESRKQALLKRRSALEQDVARLQEQLQKEKDLRATLEAALTNPRRCLTISSTLDCKIKAEIDELALAETDVINLTQKVADLQMQLNQLHQDDHVSACQSCGALHQEESKDQENDIKTVAANHNHEKSPSSEDNTSLSNKWPSPEQQRDTTSHNVNNFTEKTSSSTTSEYLTTQDPTLSSKQSSQQKQMDLGSHSETRSMGTLSGMSTDSQDVLTQDRPFLSGKQPTKSISRRKSTGGRTSSTDDENAIRRDQAFSSKHKSQRKQAECAGDNKSKAMGKTASLSTEAHNVATLDPPSLSNYQPALKLQLDLVSENNNKTKSTGEKTTLSMGSGSVVTDGPQSLSNKQPPKKKWPDLVRENSRKNKSKGETTGLSTNSVNAVTHDPNISTKKPSQKRLVGSKVHHDAKSMGIASLSNDSDNAVTQHHPSFSNKQNPKKQQQDLETENSCVTKSIGDRTSISTDYENIMIENLPLSSKQTNQKRHIDSTSQNKNRGMGTAPSRSDSQNVAIQDPSSLPSRQQSTNAKSSLPSDEPTTATRNVFSSKKPTGKVEGTASGPNALTRLANRLNFLKERRTQIAHELQILRSGGNPNSAGPPKRSTLDESKSDT